MEKLKSHIRFSCCFRGTDADPLAHQCHPASASASPWARAKAAAHIDGFRARAGIHRRRNSTGNFGYDPLSYALNFDDGAGETSPGGCNYRNFSSRLPATPPRPAAKEEVACR